MQLVANEAAEGELAMASRILAAQDIALDSMFAELARRAALNMGEYMEASERYGRLALRAQTNCRATLEALAKLHQPREQTVRPVHVNEGGQAVVADHFHNHTEGKANAKSNEQSHAAGAAGKGTSLYRSDAQGTECQSPAVRGRSRCRMHGGTNPGAPRGNRNAWKHGARSAHMEEKAGFVAAIARLMQDMYT